MGPKVRVKGASREGQLGGGGMGSAGAIWGSEGARDMGDDGAYHLGGSPLHFVPSLSPDKKPYCKWSCGP